MASRPRASGELPTCGTRSRRLWSRSASPPWPPPALADETDGFGLWGIGGNLGISFLDVDAPRGSDVDLGSPITFGVHANLGAPIESVPEILFYPFFTYWTTSEDFDGGSWDLSEWGIGMDGRYFFPTDSDIGLFGTVGLGIYGLSQETTIDEIDLGPFGGTVGGTSEFSDTGIGFRIGGGARMPLGESLQGDAQLMYKLGDADYFGILAGITWIMGD